MKNLIERFKSETPQLVQLLQALLVALATYNVFVMNNPDLLKIVPDGYEPTLTGLSSLAVLLLQLWRKKNTAINKED